MMHMAKAETIEQLADLRNEPEADEYGVLRATEHAFDLACPPEASSSRGGNRRLAWVPPA
jgi:hypothetical protein